MPRPSLSFYTFAPVLAAVFAVSSIALVVMSRPRVPPRFAELLPIAGILRGTSSGFTGATLRITAGRAEQTIDVSPCRAFTHALRPGEMVTVWLDKTSLGWRIARGTTPICTFVQSTTAEEATRQTRRRIAIVLALASVACVGLTFVGQSRARLIEPGSAA